MTKYIIILLHCLLLLGKTDVRGETCPCPDDVDIKPPDENNPSVFQDLTTKEVKQVLHYLQEDSGLNVKLGVDENISENIACIIEKKPTPKDDVLKHIDHGGPKPIREARVALATPSGMIEYTVGKLPNPTYHYETKHPKWRNLRFTDRPWLIDSFALKRAVKREAKKIKPLLHESFNGFDFEEDCGKKCLSHYDLRSLVYDNNRLIWLNILRNVPTSVGARYSYPLPLQVLMNITNTDSDLWNAVKIWYNHQFFSSPEDLMMKYNNGSVKKIVLSYNESDTYSSLRRRGNNNYTNKRGPDCFPQDGRRYSVDGHRVKYMDWEFEFTYRQSTGPQLFNIQFKKERIVYELSIQEALLAYTGKTPFARQASVFGDSEAALGNLFSPLTPGVDCPKGATYYDSPMFSYVSGKEILIPNSFCVFEFKEDQVLRRHFEHDFDGGYVNYGGMPNNVLVLKNVLAGYNYDYTVTYIFYQNGVIGIRVSASGYPLTEYTEGNRQTSGFRIHENVASLLHQHLFSFKVDIDILGRNNSHETLSIKARPTTYNVVDGIKDNTYEQYIKKKKKRFESQAAYRLQYNKPNYYLFYNNDAPRNKWGNKRAYYLDNQGVSKMLFPDKWSKMGSLAWAKYQLAVTRRHDDEDGSTTIYNSFDQENPVLNFDSYIFDNESITDKDLVAWVTVGLQHLPNSAMDVPVTTTSGSSLSFYLKPLNFFDHDPSISSYDNVYIMLGDNGEDIVEENENNAKESCSHPGGDPKFDGKYIKP